MRHRRRLGMALSLTAAFGLLAAACGSDNSSSSGATTTAAAATTTAAAGATTTAGGATTTAAGKVACEAGHRRRRADQDGHGRRQGKSIGLLYDVTGRGDKSFNDGAAAGLDKAKADYGITGNESTPTAQDGSDRPERITNMVAGGNTLVMASGSSGARPSPPRPRPTRTRSS